MKKIQIAGEIANYRHETPVLDLITQALIAIPYEHHEIHAGDSFYVAYSVESLGGMAAPDDMITLTFTTPDSLAWSHFTFFAIGTGGWRLRFIEAPTGGAASQTEQLPIINRNRNSLKTSGLIALDATEGEVSYDATLATGGNTLWDEYVAGEPKVSGFGGSGRHEMILRQNTKYQLSLYGTDMDPATLIMDWYEHTSRT